MTTTTTAVGAVRHRLPAHRFFRHHHTSQHHSVGGGVESLNCH